MWRCILLTLSACIVITLQSQDCDQLEYNVYQDATVIPTPADLQTPDGDVECYNITSQALWQFGVIWSDTQIDLTNSFEYSYYINLGWNENGADGVVFVLNGSPLGVNAIGEAGGDIGYGGAGGQGIAQSIGIEFDTWFNPFDYGDIPDDHVNLNVNGYINPDETQAVSLGNIEDGQDHLVIVSWNSQTQLLQTTFDGVEVVNENIDLINDVMGGNPLVWVGFTGSTGGNSNNQYVCDIQVEYIEVCNGVDDDCDGLIDENLDTELQLDTAICEGASVNLLGNILSETGVYTEVIPNTAGCDSTIQMDLTVLVPSENEISSQICFGDSYTFGPDELSSAGNYSMILMDQFGCDSTVNLELEVNSLPEFEEAVTICEGSSHTQGASVYTIAGNYTDVYTSAAGCDSTVTTLLEVLNVDTSELFFENCPNELLNTPQQSYGQPGIYEEIYTAENGCDSLVSITLTHLPEPSSSQTHYMCSGSSFSVGASVYTSSGVYEDVLQASNGCDSTVTTEIVVIDNLPYSDTTRCADSPLMIDLSEFPAHTVSGADYSNGSIYIFETSAAGAVQIDLDDCTLESSFSIDWLPVFESVETSIESCKDEAVSLVPRYPDRDYVWLHTSNLGSLEVLQEGEYTIRYADACGEFEDRFIVDFKDCACDVYLPTAFSPNVDRFNERFGPIHDCDLSDFQITIYDRIGTSVFQSQDPRAEWNGGIGDYYVPDGIYTWVMQYRVPDVDPTLLHLKRGMVTIVR